MLVKPLNRLLLTHLFVSSELSLKSSDTRTVSDAVYVYPLVSVALCESVFVTTTSTAPAVCEGVVTVMEVELTTVTLVADDPPNVTVAPLKNPVPVMVTDVPPLVVPEVGEIEVTVGAGAGLLATSKLSKMTFPGGFASICEVPP